MDKELKDRVFAFRTFSLPDQPMFMHMGTSYLVSDLESALLNVEAEHERLRAEVAECKKDAERYRWLRSNSTRPAEPWSTHESPESLDSVIDAALGGEGKDDAA